MFSIRQRRAIRLASRFIAPYRWQALGALLALIVTAGITLSMGQGIRLLVDQGFMTQSPHLLNQSIGLFMLLVLGLAVGTFTRFTWCRGLASGWWPIFAGRCSTT